jgi:serine/threonine-protein kinase
VVIDTNPNPAESVSKGSVVTVYYSAGARAVPSVVGLKQGQATQTLRAAGYNVNAVPDNTSTAPRGQVTSQNPPAGSHEPQGTTVTISVSQGGTQPQPTTTPTPTPTPSDSPTPSPTESSSSVPFPTPSDSSGRNSSEQGLTGPTQ